MLLLSIFISAVIAVVVAAPFSGTLTAINGNHRETVRIPRHSAFASSLGETIIADPGYSRNGPFYKELYSVNNYPYVTDRLMHPAENGALIRRRRLADDKKLDLKMKMQRVNKVVSMDAIGSYSLYRSDNKKTSLKAFGSTELWYDGTRFGLKKPGLGVQFTIYY